MSDGRPAGYSGKPLWQKLGLKPGQRVLVRGAPQNYADLVGLRAAELDLVGPRAAFDIAHVFVTSARELTASLADLTRRLPPTGVLWVSWPKRGSKVASDVGEDTIRSLALPIGVVDIKVCAVDATWSALKLVWRKDRR